MDIYETLNRIISNKRYRLLAAWFTQEEREKVDENDLPLFDLLKNISSLCIKICDSRIEFHPTYKASDGRRTFSIEDLTDTDYEVLMSVDLQKMPIVLRALVADILWTQKKKYAASKIAAESYWELFELWYTDEKPFRTLDVIKRAVCISFETKQNDLYSKICRWLDNYLMNEATGADEFFSLQIMELFINNRKYDVSRFLSVLDDIISKNNNNPSIFELAYNLKTKCLIQLKKRTDATNNNLALAECYVDFAERTAQSDAIGSIRSVDFFKKAIDLYRNNGRPKQAETIHRRLIEIQKEIPKNMVPISMSVGIEEVVKNIQVNMKGLTFEESILRLVQIVSFYRQETLKKEVLEDCRKHPLSYMFGKSLINLQGQTILSLPPLDIENPEQDQKLLELHMHQKALEKQHILGELLIKTTLQIIRDNYQIDDSSVDFVLEDNYLVPKSRKRIFKKGITMFLNGEYYEAIHILAPQTEYFLEISLRKLVDLQLR